MREPQVFGKFVVAHKLAQIQPLKLAYAVVARTRARRGARLPRRQQKAGQLLQNVLFFHWAFDVKLLLQIEF